MRFPLLTALILLVVNALVDLYIYCALHSYCRKRFWPRVQMVSAILGAAVVIFLCAMPKRSGSNTSLLWIMWMLYAYLTVYIPKYIFLAFDVLSRLPLIWHSHRWRWMSWTGFGLGILTCGVMWWGVFNRTTMEVVKVDVEIPGLPKAFQGFRIAQISDLHVGTFGSDTAFVARLVDKVNSLHPDIIVFTGDIVNRRSSELPPFTQTLSRLKAPLGVYSILGNHDTGDYFEWEEAGGAAKDVDRIKAMQGKMGWKMLNNSTAWITAGNDSIALIGVENVGEPPFNSYGDLDAAYPNLGDDRIKILLTHNPSHWQNAIEDKNTNVALTLTGHTHAMQMELLGVSPACFRYDKWGGLYCDTNDQKLYVNIGAGTVGFPSRIGATPEITLLTLKSQQK